LDSQVLALWLKQSGGQRGYAPSAKRARQYSPKAAEFPDRWKAEFLAGTEDFVMLARKYPDTFGAPKEAAVA